MIIKNNNRQYHIKTAGQGHHNDLWEPNCLLFTQIIAFLVIKRNHYFNGQRNLKTALLQISVVPQVSVMAETEAEVFLASATVYLTFNHISVIAFTSLHDILLAVPN